MNRGILQYIKTAILVFAFAIVLLGVAGEANAAFDPQPASGPWTGAYITYPDLQFYSPKPPWTPPVTDYDEYYNYGCKQSSAGVLTCHKMFPTEDLSDAYSCAGTLVDLGSAWLFNNCILVGDTEAPQTVTGLTATEVQSNRVSISWNASTDNVGVVSYRIERCAGGFGCSTWGQVGSVFAPTITYTDTIVSAGTGYSYRIIALDAAGNSSFPSTPVSVSTPPPTPPSVSFFAFPTSITIPPGGSSTLTWTVANATTCTASGAWSGAKTATTGTHTESVTPTTSGNHMYRIICTGSTAPSAVATATVTVTVIPPTVTLGPSITISPGSSTPLTWSSTNATSCVAVTPVGWTALTTTSGSQMVTPTGTTTYTISCTGLGGGPIPASATVTIAPPIVTLTGPSSVLSGTSPTLSWTVVNGASAICTASGGWSGTKAEIGGTEAASPITAPTTYTLSCIGPGGTDSDALPVGITALPPPTVALTPSSQTISFGTSATLTWSSTNADSCIAVSPAGWTNSTAISGSATVTPAATTTYTIRCTGPGGSMNDSAVVNVTLPPPPSVSFSAFPTSITIPPGGSSTLTWTVANATTCTASGAWSGAKNATAGTHTESVTLATPGAHTYTISCSGPGGGPVIRNAIVTVVTPANQLPVAIITVTPTSGDAPLTVSADGGASYDIDGSIIQYIWNWGDGSPNTTGVPSASHTYSNAGTYTLQLTVRDNQGGSGNANQTIAVATAIAPPPPPVPVSVCTAACTTDADCAPNICGPAKFCIAQGTGVGPSRIDGYVSRIDGSMSQPADSTAMFPATFPAGTTSVIMSMKTDGVNAECQYSTFSGTPYGASVMKTFSTTGTTAHAVALTGLTSVTAAAYDYYVRCRDLATDIVNDADYTISFTTNAPTIVSGPNPYTCLINSNFIRSNIPYLFDICIPK